MIIGRAKLNLEKSLSVQKDFTFADPRFVFNKPLLDILECHADLQINKDLNLIRLGVDLKVKVLLECSYTLEPFAKKIRIQEDVLISDAKEYSDDALIIIKDDIEIEPILLSLITSNLPIKPIKPGANLPKSGKGYRVINDEQLARERHESGDARFAKLDEITFEDEDNKS